MTLLSSWHFDGSTSANLANLCVMTTASGKPPTTQDGRKSDESGKSSANPLVKILKDAVSVIATVSAVVALIIAIFTWTVLGSSVLVKALFTVSLFTLVAALMCSVSLRKTKQLSLITFIAAAGVGVTCTCVTVAVIHLHKAQTIPTANVASSENSLIRSTTVKFEQRSTAANPTPVSCSYELPISGNPPVGYYFAVGNIVMVKNLGNAEPVYVPETAATYSRQKNTWLVPVTFGDASNLGDDFEASIVVMPEQELNYLLAEGRATRNIDAQQMPTGKAKAKAEQQATASWWIAPGLPPSPAFTEDTQIYQLSNLSGCSNKS
jgi:hypothetical protein